MKECKNTFLCLICKVIRLLSLFMHLRSSFSPAIRHIIFDFGAVILNIDYNLTARAFIALGLSDFDSLFSKARQTPLFDHLEKGMIRDEEFYDAVRQLSGANLSNIQIRDAWNAMLLDLPEHRMRLLEKVHKHFDAFLLSNTNAIHASAFLQSMDKARFYSAFNKVYFSHEVHLRKPEPEIFELVLKENQLLPEHTLFIDDSIQHIEAARKLGIHAYHLVEPEQVNDLFVD